MTPGTLTDYLARLLRDILDITESEGTVLFSGTTLTYTLDHTTYRIMIEEVKG